MVSDNKTVMSLQHVAAPRVTNGDLPAELMTGEVVRLVAQQLNPLQQQSLNLLIKGHGVRETARRLGISHPAVIKHRRKIARLVAELLERNVPAISAASPLPRYGAPAVSYGR